MILTANSTPGDNHHHRHHHHWKFPCRFDTSKGLKKRAFFVHKKDPKNREKGRALKSQTKQKITNHQLSSWSSSLPSLLLHRHDHPFSPHPPSMIICFVGKYQAPKKSFTSSTFSDYVMTLGFPRGLAQEEQTQPAKSQNLRRQSLGKTSHFEDVWSQKKSW